MSPTASKAVHMSKQLFQRMLVVFTLTAAIICSCSGCSESNTSANQANSPFIDSWTLESMTFGDTGETHSVEGLDTSDLTITFTDEGISVMESDGERVYDRYEINGDTATITDANTGEQLHFEMNEAETMISILLEGDVMNFARE